MNINKSEFIWQLVAIVDKKKISIQGSRYRSDKITATSDVRPSQHFGQSVDTAALELLKSSVSEVEERFCAGKKALEAILQEENGTNRSREALFQKRNALQKVQGNRRVMASRLSSKKSQLANLEKDTIDLSAEENRVKSVCGVIFIRIHFVVNAKGVERSLYIDVDLCGDNHQTFV